MKGRYSAWPLQPFSGRGAPQATANVPIEIGYKPLLEALRGLQNLRGISFMQSVQRSGWNQTSQHLIDLHAQRCALPPQTLMQQMRYADVDVFFKLVAALGSKIASLQLDGELPFAGPMIETLRMDCINASMAKPLCDSLDLSNISNLTSLDLVLDIGTGNEQHDLQRTLIARAAPSLRHLTLTLVPQHARSQAAVAYEDLSVLSLESILSIDTYDSNESASSTRYFPHLETLSLTYQGPPTPAKCKNPGRLIRPSVQVLDFADLLQRVRRTIRSITIRNIIFTTLNPSASPPNLTSPTHAHVSVHHALTSNSGGNFQVLEHFSWRVNRYAHDQKCRSAGSGKRHADCEKFLCGVYLPGCVGEMFEELAEGMAVELKEKERREGGEGTGWWDFAVGGMRARAKVG